MKYDLSKLSKDEISIIIKSISPAFAGLYCFAASQKNKLIKTEPTNEKGYVELYDDEIKVHDLWGKYNINNNSLFVMAWDHECFWPVGVKLYQDHFEIPKYKKSYIKYETKNNFDRYTKILKHIFSQKTEKQDNFFDR